MKFKLSSPWSRAFDGESTVAGGAGTGGGTATLPGGQGGGGATVSGGAGQIDDPPPSARGKTSFTQEEFNRALGEDRRKHKEGREKLITELETLKQSAGLSLAEKDALQTRIEELQQQNMTKEEQMKQEREKLANAHKKDMDKVTEERDGWKQRYHLSTILRAISDAATTEKAFANDQIVAILQPHTRLVEDLDDKGKPKGTYTPRVTFQDEKDGKPTTLDLTVPEAVKRMKELPKKYGNLFNATLVPGLGGSGSTGGDSDANVADMTPLQYREWRKKQGMARR